MATSGSIKVLELVHRDLVQLKTQAERGQCNFVRLGRQAESLKVTCLLSSLEARCRALARQRAWPALNQQPGSLDAIAGQALLALLGAMAMIDNPPEGLSCVVNTADRSLRRNGESKWAVSIGSCLTVAPISDIDFINKWVSWDSLKAALNILQVRAEDGETLGNLDRILELAGKTGLLRRRARVQVMRIELVKPVSFKATLQE